MSYKFGVRASKFRHIFGKPIKKENCYDEIEVSKATIDSRMCAVNPKFVAIITQAVGGGSFLVLPLSKTGRLDRSAPRVTGHRDIIMDIAWSPFNDYMIASASADCSIKIWDIPEQGLTTDLSEPLYVLEGHKKKVTVISWHPTASNILASGAMDNYINIWDVEAEEPIVEIFLDGATILSLSFNYNGTRLACTSRDKKLRVLDPRTGSILGETEAHTGAKCTLCVYLNNEQIITTGFTVQSERQICLWSEKDLKLDGSNADPMELIEVDQNNGVLFPFYDPDHSILYICGKGDCNIRYYEITDEKPYVHFLNLYAPTTTMKGFGWMPKRGLDVNSNEIARFYKLHGQTKFCEVVPFYVPRKSDLFQEDLYPDTAGDTAALTAEEWINGKDADPILMSLKEAYKPPPKKVKATKTREAKVTTKHNRDGENSKPVDSSAAGEPAAVSLPPAREAPKAEPEAAPQVSASNLPEDFNAQALMDDTRKLKLIVKAHERRIKTLEDKIKMYEQGSSEEEEVADA